MPAFEIHKSVSTGKVDAGYTCSAYLGGSLKELIPFCTFPFSPHPEVYMAWLYQGNGMKLYQKMYDDAGYKLKVFPISIYSSGKALDGSPKRSKRSRTGRASSCVLVDLPRRRSRSSAPCRRSSRSTRSSRAWKKV